MTFLSQVWLWSPDDVDVDHDRKGSQILVSKRHTGSDSSVPDSCGTSDESRPRCRGIATVGTAQENQMSTSSLGRGGEGPGSKSDGGKPFAATGREETCVAHEPQGEFYDVNGNESRSLPRSQLVNDAAAADARLGAGTHPAVVPKGGDSSCVSSEQEPAIGVDGMDRRERHAAVQGQGRCSNGSLHHSVDMSIDTDSIRDLSDPAQGGAACHVGHEDSDAESEYTPEEALEVLRRAAIRFSTASAHQDTMSTVSAASTLDGEPDERSTRRADWCGGDMEDVHRKARCSSTGRCDDDCASRWSSRTNSAVDLKGGSHARVSPSLEVDPARVEDKTRGGTGVMLENQTDSSGSGDESRWAGDSESGGGGNAAANAGYPGSVSQSGPSEEQRGMKVEDAEAVLRMEKTFKKACKVLGEQDHDETQSLHVNYCTRVFSKRNPLCNSRRR